MKLVVPTPTTSSNYSQTLRLRTLYSKNTRHITKHHLKQNLRKIRRCCAARITYYVSRVESQCDQFVPLKQRGVPPLHTIPPACNWSCVASAAFVSGFFSVKIFIKTSFSWVWAGCRCESDWTSKHIFSCTLFVETDVFELLRHRGILSAPPSP